MIRYKYKEKSKEWFGNEPKQAQTYKARTKPKQPWKNIKRLTKNDTKSADIRDKNVKKKNYCQLKLTIQGVKVGS